MDLMKLATKIAALMTEQAELIAAGDMDAAADCGKAIAHHRRGYTSAAVYAGLDLS